MTGKNVHPSISLRALSIKAEAPLPAGVIQLQLHPPHPNLLLSTHPQAASSTTPSRTSVTTPSRHKKSGRAPSVSPRRWRDLTKAERFTEVVREAERAGGYALSLNLSIGREGGTLSSDNPMRNLSKRISEALASDGLSGLPIALHLEASREGRVHLHGVIIPADDDDLKLIAKTLRRGAGFVQGPAGRRQALLRPITEADGWRSYMAKDCRATRAALGDDRLTYVSQSLTRRTRDAHELRRRETLATPAPANKSGAVLHPA